MGTWAKAARAGRRICRSKPNATHEGVRRTKYWAAWLMYETAQLISIQDQASSASFKLDDRFRNQ